MDKLPAWKEVARKQARHETLTALEQFIYDWCPVQATDEKEFYADLTKVVEEARSGRQPNRA